MTAVTEMVKTILLIGVGLHVLMGMIAWRSLRRAQRGWSKQVVAARPLPAVGFVASLFGYLGWFGGSVAVATDSSFISPITAFDIRMGAVILFLGHALFGWTLWAIGASFGLRPRIIAEHRLVTRGPYRVVRHPMYTALHVIYLGTFLLVPSWFFLVCLIAAVVGNTIRAAEEERVLLARYGQDYAVYREVTGRFFPKLFRASASSALR